MLGVRIRVALCAGIVVAGNIAAADDTQVAREHFQNGTKALGGGRYDDAIAELTKAYEAKGDRLILYNLAQAHFLADHHVDALRLYQMYLLEAPEAQNRREVMAKIDALQKEIELELFEQPNEARPIPGGRAPDSPANPQKGRPGRTKTISGIVLTLAGAGAVVGGIACAALSNSASEVLTKADSQMKQFDPATYRAGQRYLTAESILLSIGSVVVLTGIVLAVLGHRDAQARAKAVTMYIQ